MRAGEVVNCVEDNVEDIGGFGDGEDGLIRVEGTDGV